MLRNHLALEKFATIETGIRRQMVIYFDSPDTVSADRDDSFNPCKSNQHTFSH